MWNLFAQPNWRPASWPLIGSLRTFYAFSNFLLSLVYIFPMPFLFSNWNLTIIYRIDSRIFNSYLVTKKRLQNVLSHMKFSLCIFSSFFTPISKMQTHCLKASFFARIDVSRDCIQCIVDGSLPVCMLRYMFFSVCLSHSPTQPVSDSLTITGSLSVVFVFVYVCDYTLLLFILVFFLFLTVFSWCL